VNQLTRYKPPRMDFSAPDPVEVRDADLDLTMIVRLIRRRIGLIGLVTVLLTALILPLIMMIKPVYVGEASFLIQAPLVPDPAGAKTGFNLDDEMQRVLARANVERVVAQFDLASRPEFNPALKKVTGFDRLISNIRTILAGSTGTLPGKEPDRAAAVLTAIYDRLAVTRLPESTNPTTSPSGFMQISFKSKDPKMAAEVPNALIEAYLSARRAFHESRTQEAMSQVDARISAQQARVDAASQEIRAFQQETGVGRVVDIQTNQLVLLNAQQADLVKRRLDLQSKIASVDAALADNGPPPLNETDSLVLLRQNLQTEQNELTRLRDRFGDGFNLVQAQRSRIAILEAAIRDELSAWGRSMKAQLAQLDKEEAELAANDSAAHGALSKTSIAEVQLAELVRHAGVQSQILESIESEKSQLEGVSKQPVFDLERLSPATEPIRPQGRGRAMYLILAFFASSMIAVAVAGMIELTDQTVRSHQQLSAEPGLTPVGMLPVRGRRGQRSGQTDIRFKDALRGVLLAIENENGGVQPTSLMVTTAVPGEAASFVAHAMARELVESGREVLIVDAVTPPDGFLLRGNPRGRPGLAEYLRRDASFLELISDTDLKGLRILHRGDGPLSHLNDAERIEHILDYGSAFDQMVLFICPPVLNNTSVLRIAGVVQRVLLVMDWGVTSRDSVLLASQRLRTGHVDRVLTVLNKVQPKRYALYSYRDAAAFPNQTPVSGW
jgi:uncharacterized protein involved in exopolysaccharide biosynthesis/Mrp family chromosome partitioning ATPase